jgi:hypothetical protein
MSGERGGALGGVGDFNGDHYADLAYRGRRD